MEKDNNFLINVQIGGFKLPLRVPRSEEEIYRKAEKLLTKYLNDYQGKYNQRTSEEILILVAYQLAVMVSKKEIAEDTAPIAEKLSELNEELNKLLSE